MKPDFRLSGRIILLSVFIFVISQQAMAQDAIDLSKVISAADLDYQKPASRSEEGMPVGNGRMGSLVWTSPTSLKFQINRVDVFGNNSASNNFFERNTDYCSGTGFVDIDFVNWGNLFPVWPGEWDASFKLLCRGNFLISSSFKNGKVASLEIFSQSGSECKILNPWTGKKVTFFRNGKKAESKADNLLIFNTKKNERINIIPIN